MVLRNLHSSLGPAQTRTASCHWDSDFLSIKTSEVRCLLGFLYARSWASEGSLEEIYLQSSWEIL